MKDYTVLKDHYENCLRRHGATAKGMDWPNMADLEKRFKVLTDLIPFSSDENSTVDLLDLGCGVGLLIDFLEKKNLLKRVNYHGIDISDLMVETARELRPGFMFEERDILLTPLTEDSFDYIIMNGLFTEKREMTQDQMFEFLKNMTSQVFRAAKKGIAFNVMSTHVDWKRDDLFHLELDVLVDFLVKNCSRNISIRMDYGLYEFVVHVKK